MGQALFHELIHSSIARAQLALSKTSKDSLTKAVEASLTPRQKVAIHEIKALYTLTKKNANTQAKELYGLTNEREFIAELANPSFRGYLKEQNIFKRVLDSIVKFFTPSKAKKGDEALNTLQALRDSYEKFLDNFDYEKAGRIPKSSEKGEVTEAVLESAPKMQGERMLKNRLLEVEGKINYQYLQSIASPLPKPLTQEEFLAQFGTGKARTHIETPIKELEIEPAKAWEHLASNSKEQDRQRISGALLEVLQKPLFITKDTKGTFYFYKPYKDEKGVLNLVSITIPKSNRIRYKTSYIASRERMLKMINEYELVYESF